MLNIAVFKAIEKNLDYLTKHCGNCTKILECEEHRAVGDYDYEPKYCKSIIEAACMNAVNFKIPFPKGGKYMDRTPKPSDIPKQLQEIQQLQAEITEKNATIKHLKGKAEFDMPASMRGHFHNACTDSCDTIDGPCACGAWHSAKEWIGKLNKRVQQLKVDLDQVATALGKCGADKANLKAEFDNLKTFADKVGSMTWSYIKDHSTQEAEDDGFDSKLCDLISEGRRLAGKGK